ncbi:MAG: redoxin domain-containing protein [Verrucomicrobiota bacterium]
MPIAVDTKAPDFTLKTKTASGLEDITLSDQLGKKNVVILFFPLAFTSVCTDEMCSISTGIGTYEDLNAVVYAVSVDSPFAQEAWAQKEKITIPVLSDLNKEVAKAYDVLLPDLIGLGAVSARAAFIVDKFGVIKYSEQTATPGDLPDFDAIKETLKGMA